MSAFNDPSPEKPVPPSGVMRAPHDADNYRIKVGRYRDRWYRDPLPADETADETDGTWPAVSGVKKATGQDWTFVALKRVARAANLDEIASMGYFERYEQLKVINKLDLSAASRRGNNVHLWAECRAYGVPPYLTDTDEGSSFFPVVDKMWAELQPELWGAEFVAVHRDLNGIGYGGTSDGIFRIDGKLYMVDWKSRGDTSEHDCYPEEAAQLGAYAGAEYAIVADDDLSNRHGAKRVPVPKLEGGLIVSIKSDSYEVYPVDLDAAAGHFEALHAWWLARRSEKASIGHKWAPRRAVEPEADLPVEPSPEAVAMQEDFEYDERKAKLLARHRRLNAEQTEMFTSRVQGINKNDLDAVEALLDDIENPPTVLESARKRMERDAARQAEREATAEVDETVDEGGPADPADLNIIKTRWEMAVERAGRKWIARLVSEALEAERDFRLSTSSTQRRADIYCAVSAWASSIHFDPDDDSGFRAALAFDDPTAPWGLPVGELLGELTTEQAARLREVVNMISEDGGAALVHGEGVPPRWRVESKSQEQEQES